MALVRIPETIASCATPMTSARFSPARIEYEARESHSPSAPTRRRTVLLAAYSDNIDALKARGGYLTADFIDFFFP